MVNLSSYGQASLSAYEREVLNILQGGEKQGSLYQRVIAAPDLFRISEYTDIGTDDERPISTTWSSAVVGAAFAETYTYAGQPGRYRVVQVSRTQV